MSAASVCMNEYSSGLSRTSPWRVTHVLCMPSDETPAKKSFKRSRSERAEAETLQHWTFQFQVTLLLSQTFYYSSELRGPGQHLQRENRIRLDIVTRKWVEVFIFQHPSSGSREKTGVGNLKLNSPTLSGSARIKPGGKQLESNTELKDTCSVKRNYIKSTTVQR